MRRYKETKRNLFPCFNFDIIYLELYEARNGERFIRVTDYI